MVKDFQVFPRAKRKSFQMEEPLFASPCAQSHRDLRLFFSYEFSEKFIMPVITPNSSLARAVDNASGN